MAQGVEKQRRRIPWPTDMAVRDDTTMLIIDAHRPINGLAVIYRVLGFRPGMLVSSLGRCYVAFCPKDERRQLVAKLARSTRGFDRMALRAGAVRRMVALAREQGYCTRDPSETSLDSPERFGALSVPVYRGECVIACLSCAWLPLVCSEREIVSAYLSALQGAARAIGEPARQAGCPCAHCPPWLDAGCAGAADLHRMQVAGHNRRRRFWCICLSLSAASVVDEPGHGSRWRCSFSSTRAHAGRWPGQLIRP